MSVNLTNRMQEATGRTKPRILVVGDVMLDRYLHGKYTRPNPEGNGRVFSVDRKEERLGGAAAVAMLAASLGADVGLAGVIGDDESGKRVRELCRGYGLSDAGLVIEYGRPTTTKERRVCCGHPLPDRVDHETTLPVGNAIADQLAVYIKRFIASGCDAVLFSDYGKGVLTPRVLDVFDSIAYLTIVDPARDANWRKYDGLHAIIKANLPEARAAAGRPNASAIELVENWQGHDPLVVTAGSDGIYFSCCGETGHIASLPVSVIDVCGAGDTVLAALGMALATRDIDFGDACEFANRAAALQVQRLGVSAIRQDEMDEVVATETCPV
jgi:rfaE bifunctional protein kinase chain/domain